MSTKTFILDVINCLTALIKINLPTWKEADILDFKHKKFFPNISLIFLIYF